MSHILYYSIHCKNCDKLLSELSKTELQNDIYFVCIDKRYKRNNTIYITTDKGEEIAIPDGITKIPALMCLQQNNRILFGNDIYQLFEQKKKKMNENATCGNMEPMAFTMQSGSNFVQSDVYSFLDTDPEDLNAKGAGGLRQTYHYAMADYDNINQIQTPPEDYTADKVDETQYKDYSERRSEGIPTNNRVVT